MNTRPYIIIEPAAAPVPLVVDSPHSGRAYPVDFDYACPLPTLRQTEDFMVDELVSSAARSGATVIAAQFPRCYIDTNRAENDIDAAVLGESWYEPLAPTERTHQGLGLIPRLCKSGVSVYRAPLSAGEILKRITHCYRPYHEALTKTMARNKALFGECFLINCHSMPDRKNESGFGGRPDFILGDRNGTSCDPSFTRLAHQHLLDLGYNVALNDPYKGMEIVRRYGQPQHNQHALQLEINRRLYMNEKTLEPNQNYERLRRDLAVFFENICSELGGLEAPERIAAE